MKNLKCKLVLLCLFVFAPFFSFAQTNLSVPLRDNVYQLLEYASLRGYISILPAVYCAYTFSYTQHSYGDTTSFYFINNSEYYDEVGNYLTLSVKI